MRQPQRPSRRPRLRFAAVCAFVIAALEVISFGQYLAVRSAGPGAIVSSPFVTVLRAAIGVPALVIAMWTAGRLQRDAAPVSARIGQWAVVAGIAAGVAALTDAVTIVVLEWPAVFWAQGTLMNLAFGALGLATRGSRDPTQRWASGAMLLAAVVGAGNIVWRLAALPAVPGLWHSFALLPLLRVAAFAAVGVWLWRRDHR